MAFRDPWTRNNPAPDRSSSTMRWTSCQARREAQPPGPIAPFRLARTRCRTPPARSGPLRRASDRLRLLRQRGIRSATRVPRIGCERFRADTLDEAPDTRRTAHFPVHPCTVFSAPLLDPPSGRSQRCSHPTCERCARRALSSSRRHDAGHVGRPALGRAHPAARRRSSPSGPAPLHKKQCSRSNGRTKPPSRPRWKSARRTVAFGPRRRRAGRLALFLPSPCRAIRRAPGRMYRIRDEEDDS